MVKKGQAWFTSLRWKKIASAVPATAVSVKTLTALEGGRPLA